MKMRKNKILHENKIGIGCILFKVSYFCGKSLIITNKSCPLKPIHVSTTLKVRAVHQLWYTSMCLCNLLSFIYLPIKNTKRE